MKVVIPAGGRGTRLKPYTTVFPKPLLPVGDRPILEIIIHQLKSCGLQDIIITVGHLSELIINFFGNGSRFGVNIDYSQEDQPLGTVGGLGLIKDKLTDTFLMINGDTLTTLNFLELVNYHKKERGIGTIALNKRQVYIDFGIVELDSASNIKRYTEKPALDYLVSTGIYVFEPQVLEYIKVGEKLDFPDLVKTIIANGKDIKGFIYDGFWLDIGRPEDYEQANRDIEKMRHKLGLEVI